MTHKPPPLIIPRKFTKEFIRSKTGWIFVYSADVTLKGVFGQMWVAHGEPNCYPYYVMWKPCKSSGYFQDTQYDEIMKVNEQALDNIVKAADNKPVIPFVKMGCGNSRFNEFAPKTYNDCMLSLACITYPNIVYGTY